MSKFGWSYPPGAADDPMAPYNQVDEGDYGLEDLRAWLNKAGTRRWKWEKIAHCLTGKDADLEPWGQQGIEVQSCDDETVYCTAHFYKVVPGTEITLNTPDDISEECYEKALETYMEEAQEIVMGTTLRGEWDGDDWCFSESIEFTVPWVLGKDGVPNIEETGQKVIYAGVEALKEVEAESLLLDEAISVAAGWERKAEPEDEDDRRTA